ncbi:MAG: ABC transporter permease [Spirochaetaceae bacterium]
MNKLLIIFKHEFRQITKGKLFILMTLLAPLFFIGLIVIIGFVSNSSQKTEENASIAIYCQNEEIISSLKSTLIEEGLNIIVVENEKKGKELVIQEECKGFTYIPDDIMSISSIKYYSSTGTDFQYSKIVLNAVRDFVFNQKKLQLGLSLKESNWLSEKIDMKSLKLSDDGSTDDSNFQGILIVVMAISFLIMITVVVYGISAARSVLTDKASKTIEMLLSSVDPYKILLGKVLGSGLAGLLQFSIWMTMAALAIKLILPLIKLEIPLGFLTTGNIISIFILFILGFFFYLFIYGAMGANVENEQNLGQLQIPLQMVLMIPWMLNTSIISNPNSTMAKVLSYIPFTSPTVMTTRVLIDSPGIPMVILSMSILLGSLILVLFASAKLFKIGLLTKGKKINFIQFIGYLFKK